MKQEYIEQKINIGNLQIHVLLSDGFFQVNAPWKMPLHAHSTWEIHYIFQGSVDFDARNVPVSLQQGDLAIVPPYQYHSVRGHSADMKKTSLIFSFSENKTVEDPADYYHYYMSLLKAVKHLICIRPQRTYYEGMLSCIEEYTAEGKLILEKFSTLLKLIFLDLSEELCRYLHLPKLPGQSFALEESSENIVRKKQADDFIYRRFQEQITVEDLAKHLHLSVRQTNRFLNENMQIGFNEFVRDYRMQMAVTLLREYRRDPQEVAFTVGYRSYRGFAEAFKKVMGMTPTQFFKMN